MYKYMHTCINRQKERKKKSLVFYESCSAAEDIQKMATMNHEYHHAKEIQKLMQEIWIHECTFWQKIQI